MLAGELLVLFGLQTDSGSFGKAEGLVKSLRRTVASLIGIQSVKAVTNFVEETAHAGTEILSLSKQIGISAKTFQEWGYVAKQSGSNSKEFVTAIGQLERNLRAVHEGGGGKLAQHAMKELGLTSADVAKALASPDGLSEALFKVSAKVQKLGITAETASAMTVLFGRRAKGIMGDLAQGPEALRAQIQKIHDLGGVVPEKDLKRLKQVDNTINDLKFSLSAMAKEAVAVFGPQLVEMLQDARNWLQQNKELVATGITAALKTVAFLFQVIATAIVDVVEVVRWFRDGLREGSVLATTLFTVLVGGAVFLISKLSLVQFILKTLIGSVGLIVRGIMLIGPAIGRAIVAGGPWLIALAGIAALVYEIYENWDMIVSAIKRATQAISDFINGTQEANDTRAIAMANAEASGNSRDMLAAFMGNGKLGKSSGIDKIVQAPSVPATSQHAAASAAGKTGAGHTTNVTNNVTVGDIHGVKDAHDVGKQIANEMDKANRHAADNYGRSPR